MLKTQITGAKYLSPQTNQMTNLNIAVPADSKDTEFGTSDILLAKDVVAYLNALDSDISKELDTQTDKINKINQSIKQLIDHNLIKIVTELPTTDIDKNCIYLVPNKDGEGNNVFIEYIYVESKNTFEEVGRIQAKVDLSDYYTKEETDNQIQIAKNSAINIHNEDNTRSIKLDNNDDEAAVRYNSAVNVSLTDADTGSTININAEDGFRHIDSSGSYSNLYSTNLDVNNGTHATSICADYIYMHNSDETSYIEINTNKELTEEEQEDGLSPIDISLTDGAYNANINAQDGFRHKTDDGFVSMLDGYRLNIGNPVGNNLYADDTHISLHNNENEAQINIDSNGLDNYLQIGSDEKFKISRPTDNTEGATITGVQSITAFANPSATKVWATDGSTVDLTTKANASDLDAKANKHDVLLKKSASSGYYIEGYIGQLGTKAFAANSECTASGYYSFAEGSHIEASGSYSHAEGVSTKAIGTGSHAEGTGTKAQGHYAHAEGETTNALGNHSHAEGLNTTASDDFSHAEGSNTDAQHGSHAEGYYTHAVGTYPHAEGEYTSASGSYSHAEGFATQSNGNSSHSEGNSTNASGYCSHAQGICNVDNKNAIHSVGIGDNTTRKNAEYIYNKNDENGYIIDDPKNGYKYLIGVGGYDGISTDNSTYKSVQEVIADLTARIEQLETKVRALEAANTPA